MRKINPVVIKRAAQAAKRQAAAQAQRTAKRIRAEVVAKSTSGRSVRIRQAHQTVAPQKFYPVLSTPYPLAVNDQIEGLIQNGGLVVLGRRLRSTDKTIPDVDANANGRVSKSGDTMTGLLTVARTLGGTPTAFLDMNATDGPTISMRIGTAGELYFRDVTNGRTLLTLFATGEVGVHTDPTLDGSATTKRYVDGKTAMPAWIAPTLLNGWVNHSATQESAGYRRTPWKEVQCRGLIASGAATDGTTLFTLPTGYRPAAIRHFVSVQGNNGACRIRVQIDGRVEIVGVTSNNFLSLESIRFDVP